MSVDFELLDMTIPLQINLITTSEMFSQQQQTNKQTGTDRGLPARV
jgi:hypothetical protein